MKLVKAMCVIILHTAMIWFADFQFGNEPRYFPKQRIQKVQISPVYSLIDNDIKKVRWTHSQCPQCRDNNLSFTYGA